MVIQIHLKSYDSNLLDYFCKKILSQIKIKSSGPVFLPNLKKTFVVIKSSHVYSLSREVFNILIHRRIIIIRVPFNFFKSNKKLNYTHFLKKKLLNKVPSGISLKLNYKYL